ncbi:putative PH domain-containing protein [Rosa chinensis]|uniref:Putative PH domain-containing protein n=1 Tax=Rosa chinensis TaxID=74649 RepID=A0A2P6RUC0_ROSCH|nr:putative PH domain-containing protein [Rosa chinensis]
MEQDQKILNDQDDAEVEALELVLFQVSECYVYLIPPRKSAASYRADEWDVNKWVWEGILKVISKGEDCIIRLEEKSTEPHPVEPVIDSSRYFVLRVEENIDGRLRHAFIGLGFRERTEAYDFQAALHDHMKYLNKKKTAEEMEQKFQQTSSVDYSLKEGETLVLQLKSKSSEGVKSKLSEQGVSNSPPAKKSNQKESLICIKPPPPPPGPLSPSTNVQKSPSNPPNLALEGASKLPESMADDSKEMNTSANQSTQEIPDDDFGDFQAAV